MIAYSKQIRIVTNLSLSFQKNEKINVSVSNNTLERDKIFLKPYKYQQYTDSDFKFIVLWIIFKYNISKIGTLKHLQELEIDDIKEIMKEKQKILLYKNTLKNDMKIIKSKITNSINVINLYKKKEISCLYVFWYFENNNYELTRLQQRQLDRIRFFISYFPKIEEYLGNKIE
jgi:hypothetical protein